MYYKLLFIVSRNLEDLSNLSDLEGLTRKLNSRLDFNYNKFKLII